MRERRIRRMAGLLKARLPEMGLEEVVDPRARAGRWSLAQILRATLIGLMGGCRSLWETEQLTDALSPAVRELLSLPRRLADTTMRDLLCRMPLDALRACLHRLVKAAWRRKALEPVGVPFGVAALDGKATALPSWDDQWVQRHLPEEGQPYGLARTVTCSLVSALGRPCIDAIPVPAHTNEMGQFAVVFRSLIDTYGSLFQMVTYDAGALSQANGQLVVDAGKDYLFSLKGEQRTMFKLAEELLDPADVADRTVDVLDRKTTVTRSLVLLTVQSQWAYGDGKSPEESVWSHARTFLRVESAKVQSGQMVEHEVRLFVSSCPRERLTPQQWLTLIRSHWGVENNNHHTLDTAFQEDDRPWIVTSPEGMLAVLILRRIAYTLLTLFRSVSSRSEENRTIRWKALLTWVRDALVAAGSAETAALRDRELVAAI
jgi:hypothetical protein